MQGTSNEENVSYTEKYTPYIKKLVHRLWRKHGSRHDYDDLLSIAFVASVEAEKDFNPDKAKFSSYVKARVQGAITRQVSNISSVQHKLLLKMYKIIEKYSVKHSAVPSRTIIMEELGITSEQFSDLLDATSNVSKVSLDTLAEDELSEESDLDTLAEFAKVQEILITLPTKEQNLVNDFLQDPTMDPVKIANVIQILRDKLKIKDI